MPRLSERFDPRDNGITPLRLILALLVVFSHSWVAGGFGSDPLYRATGGQLQIGTVAVVAFFALSGFLLTSTRARRGRTEFAWHRFLRIAPGLAVNVAMTVFIALPLAGLIAGTGVVATGVGDWVVSVATARIRMPEMPGAFPGTARPDLPNISLWTLSTEIWCYVLLCIAPARWSAIALTGLLSAAAGLHVWLGGQDLLLHLPIAFAIGGLMARGADRVPMHGAVAAALIALMAVASWSGLLATAAPFALPYIAIWVAVASPVRWTRDLSYGVYIYAWPIQQLVATAGGTVAGYLPYLAAVLPPVLAAAYLSSRLVEEPALQLRPLAARVATRIRRIAAR